MYAIADAWEPDSRSLLSDLPLPLLVALGTLTASAGIMMVAGVLPLTLARALGAGGAQGALLAAAVAWMRSRGTGQGPSPAVAALVVLAGALSAALVPAGSAAYVLAPMWLWRERTRLAALGATRASGRLVAAGAALGAGLGTHLLITASLTRGYGAHVPTIDGLAVWLAYDAGANVLTTEAFFRGALFDRAQRRWGFAAATAATTAACVARYLVDPLLPRTVEITAGAIFYLTLLSVANCWLYWRSGSIVPGVAAGITFFVAYRLLHAAQ